jgi:hypothetical protein
MLQATFGQLCYMYVMEKQANIHAPYHRLKQCSAKFVQVEGDFCAFHLSQRRNIKISSSIQKNSFVA